MGHVRERKGHLRQMPERVHQLRQKAVQKSNRHEEAHEKVGPGRQRKGQLGCKAAAKAMKKTFGIVTNARYPKGCFFLNNKVYFNPGKTGRGHGAASPVCVATAGATKKPTKKLFLAASGKANCAGKGVAVKNENGCKAAAKAMKKDFTGSRGY